MFQPHNQLSIQTKPLAIQEPSALMHVDPNNSFGAARDEMHNGGLSKAESAVNNSKKLQDELQTLGFKIKQHEDNIKYLKTQKDNLDGSILDLQVTLGKYCSSSIPTMENEALSKSRSENETVEQILKYEKSAAAILCQLKIRHGSQASHLTLAKDVLGIVATLGKVDDENLSRLFSEYLGLETMMAIVCKTYEGVKTLETYDFEGGINKHSGLHGLGSSIGRHLDGRFRIICLEHLRPYAGDFVADDPQRRLDLLKPRLPNGECPPGFLGFAVNMINVDSANILCLTSSGCGLRETLFYNLFSRLQVYRTRAEMLLALPCITDGALSLDGGMIKTAGVFSLGSREDVEVRFPKSSGSNLPLEYFETEKELTEVNWKREKVEEDIQREQSLLNHINYTFRIKKQAFIKYLADSSPYGIQQQIPGERERLTQR